MTAAVFVFGGPTGGLASEETGLTTERARELVGEVGAAVAEIRGLEFRREVPVEVIDDDTALKHMTARILKFQSREEIAAQQEAFALLGLLEPGTDLLAMFLAVLEEQAGGFYDPETGSFFLLDDMPASIASVLIAHELTHALEDQYFDLDERLERAMGDDDRLFALGAVHEGSATLLMSVFTVHAMGDGSLTFEDLSDMQETEAVRGERLAAMPPVLGRAILGPYVLGMGFLLRGGSPANVVLGFPAEDVARAYESGPLSSEQILHPEKYWDPEHRDDPVDVDLGDARAALGRAWKPRAGGVLGELGVAVLVGAGMPGSASDPGIMDPTRWTNEAASGWGGDRWLLWSRGERSVVALKTVWDTETDAAEFRRALEDREASIAWERRGLVVAGVAGDLKRSARNRLLEALLPGD
jgi:hypothetical protein